MGRKKWSDRGYQNSAVDKAQKHFAKHKRGKVIWPCGMGKSLLGVWIAQALGAKRVLVCVPSLALVQQTLKVWAGTLSGKNVDCLCVCSNRKVGRGDDEWQVDPSELDISVTTDASDVQDFLRKRSGSMKVVFSTYHSSRVVAEGASGSTFDFAIFDEAHRTAGSDGVFSHLLYDDNVKIRKRLFMTATERYYRGDKKDVVSMCDKKVYGETIDFISFRQGIKDKWLSDYQLVTIVVTRGEVAKLVKKNPIVIYDTGEEAEVQMIAAALAMRKVMDENKLKRAITFHSTIARAKAFAEIQRTLIDRKVFDPIEVLDINGSESTAVRQQKMDTFRDKKKRSVISNARCLVEGVDIPDVDLILFADPKRSLIDIVQAAGRAMRPGKKMGYIVVPVVVEDGASEQDIQKEEFGTVIEIVKAMGSADERLVQQMRVMAYGSDGEKEGVKEVLVLDSLRKKRVKCAAIGKEIGLMYHASARRMVPMMSHDEWRSTVRQLQIPTSHEYRHRSKSGELPVEMPSNPDRTYGETWTTWSEELTGEKRTPKKSHDEWRREVRRRGIKSGDEYSRRRAAGELPPGMPANPDRFYKTWTTWNEELGKEVVPFVTHEQWRSNVRRAGIASAMGYRYAYDAGELPPGMPSIPDKFYSDTWTTWPEELGKKIVPIPSLKVWRQAVRRAGITSKVHYGRMRRDGKLPPGMPANPDRCYRAWTTWQKELGKRELAAA